MDVSLIWMVGSLKTESLKTITLRQIAEIYKKKPITDMYYRYWGTDLILSYRVEQQQSSITLDVLCPALNKGLQSNIVGTKGENLFLYKILITAGCWWFLLFCVLSPVEVDLRIIAILGLAGVASRECAEEGVGQKTGYLLLRKGQRLIHPWLK